MKSILAILTTAVFMGFGVSAVLAEDSGSQPAGKGDRKHCAKAFFGKLNLTDDQKAQVKEILKAAHEQAKSATDKDAKIKIMKDAFEKIKTTVLTDEQRQMLEKAKEKFKERKGQKANAES